VLGFSVIFEVITVYTKQIFHPGKIITSVGALSERHKKAQRTLWPLMHRNLRVVFGIASDVDKYAPTRRTFIVNPVLVSILGWKK